MSIKCWTELPQLKEIFFMWPSYIIAYIIQSFQKLSITLFVKLPPSVSTALCKEVVDTMVSYLVIHVVWTLQQVSEDFWQTKLTDYHLGDLRQTAYHQNTMWHSVMTSKITTTRFHVIITWNLGNALYLWILYRAYLWGLKTLINNSALQVPQYN